MGLSASGSFVSFLVSGAESISPDAGIQDNSELSDFNPSPGMPEDDFCNIPSVLLGGGTDALPNRNSGSGASPNRTETENPLAGYNVFQIPKPTGSEAASNRYSASGSGVLPNRTEAEKLSQKFRPLFNAASKVEFFSDETKITAKNEELITKEIYRNNCYVKDVNDVKDTKDTCAVKTSDIRDKVVYKSYVRDCDIEIKRLPGSAGIGVWTRVPIEAGQTIGPCAVNNRGGISQLVRRFPILLDIVKDITYKPVPMFLLQLLCVCTILFRLVNPSHALKRFLFA